MDVIRKGGLLLALTAFLHGAAAAAGTAIVLDPGHGGDDLGAVVAGRNEKDIALAVARKLRDRLAPLAVRLTRNSDVYLPLDRRIEASHAHDGAVFVSLHADQVKRRDLKGIPVYAFGRVPGQKLPRAKRWTWRRPLPNLADPPRAQARAGLSLARSVTRTLRNDGFDVEAPARAPYYVLKNPRVPSILIEMGYLSNPEEAARLADPAYQDRLADALARGVRDYLGSQPERASTSLAR